MHVYIVQPDTFKDDCPLESKIEQESAASEPSSNWGGLRAWDLRVYLWEKFRKSFWTESHSESQSESHLKNHSEIHFDISYSLS